MSKFKTEIFQFPEFRQPGHQLINGIKVFIWVGQDNIMKISLSGGKDGNFYEVSEVDFQNCLILEEHFKHFKIETLNGEEIEHKIWLISKLHYPELFKFD